LSGGGSAIIAVNQPSSQVVDTVLQKLNRLRLPLMTLAIVVFLAGAAIALWWAGETNDNWQLWHDRVPIEAEVVGLGDRILLPTDLEVQFEWEGSQQVRTIPPLWIPWPPHWFQTWDSDMIGQQVTILLDPANPEMVRLQDQDRVDPLHILLVIAGSLIAGTSAAA
jgi:hypothetical protein